MVVKTFLHCNQEILEWCWASDHEMMHSPYWASCYLIDGLLIDSGAPGGVNDLRNFVRSLGNQKIGACVLTHTHEDHAGGAYMLNYEFSVPIYASEKAIPILKAGYTYPEYRQVAWGKEGVLPVAAELLPNSISSMSGRYTFHVLPIPGHAPDQIALIEKHREWAFVSDGIQVKYKRIFGSSSSIPEDISLIYRSIQEISRFTEKMTNLKIFIPGGKIFGRDLIDHKLQEIWNLRFEVHEFITQGFSVDEIVVKIFGEQDIFDSLTNGKLSKKNLIISLIEWIK
ncbi:MAG: MBL fold metallo-hydrolase [Candidatus Heimdallarchaeota archaeon]|nr:MAG: MBL fold metallo-hydrolase [Candidatus Heimdallarchaeota archaeon]